MQQFFFFKSANTIKFNKQLELLHTISAENVIFGRESNGKTGIYLISHNTYYTAYANITNTSTSLQREGEGKRKRERARER